MTGRSGLSQIILLPSGSFWVRGHLSTVRCLLSGHSSSESRSGTSSDCGETPLVAETRMYLFHVDAQRTAMRRAPLLRLRLTLLVSCQRATMATSILPHRVKDLSANSMILVERKMGCLLHPSTSALRCRRAAWRTRRSCHLESRRTMGHLYARAHTNMIFTLRYIAERRS